MRKIITLLVGIVFSMTALIAQEAPPQAFSFKATIKDSKGLPVLFRKINLRISVLQGDMNGLAVYSEYFTPTTNLYSQVDIEIGRGNVLSGDFPSIDWSSGEFYLKIEVDVKGGTNYTLLSVTQLLSVPYALYAGSAGNAFSGNYDDLIGAPVISLVATSGSYNDLANKPTTDGSETKVSSGTNITVTGDGTEVSPYVINSAGGSGALTLSQVLTFGNDARDNNIVNLNDPVNAQDAATKAYVDAIKETIYNELLNAGLNGFVMDIEGNTYKTIKIGNQVWMKENLRSTQYSDGIPIPNVTDNTTWNNLNTPAYCWYNNDKATYGSTYGALYNWYTINTSNLCPSGWHVPVDIEWDELTYYLGGQDIAGGKLKETGTTHWLEPNYGASNSSGFTALPGGYRSKNGAFYYIGNIGGWWSASFTDATQAWNRGVYYNGEHVSRGSSNKEVGFSVRCVRDRD